MENYTLQEQLKKKTCETILLRRRILGAEVTPWKYDEIRAQIRENELAMDVMKMALVEKMN